MKALADQLLKTQEAKVSSEIDLKKEMSSNESELKIIRKEKAFLHQRNAVLEAEYARIKKDLSDMRDQTEHDRSKMLQDLKEYKYAVADKNQIIEKMHSDLNARDAKIRESKQTLVLKIKEMEKE